MSDKQAVNEKAPEAAAHAGGGAAAAAAAPPNYTHDVGLPDSGPFPSLLLLLSFPSSMVS